MKLSDTVTLMNSEDYKERFKAEYFQLINRIEGLSTMLDNYRQGTLTFEPKCTLKLLDGQFRGMSIYRSHLEERAKLELISLEEVITVVEPIVTETVEGQTTTKKQTNKTGDGK